MVCYVVIIKTIAPRTLKQTTGFEIPITYSDLTKQMVWAWFVCFGIMFPLSLPRQIKESKWQVVFVIVLSLYFAFVILQDCFLMSEDFQASVKAAFVP